MEQTTRVEKPVAKGANIKVPIGIPVSVSNTKDSCNHVVVNISGCLAD